jgi:hypothetical protein
MFVLDDAIDEVPSEILGREERAHFLSFVVVVLNECLEEMTMMMMGASMSAAGE